MEIWMSSRMTTQKRISRIPQNRLVGTTCETELADTISLHTTSQKILFYNVSKSDQIIDMSKIIFLHVAYNFLRAVASALWGYMLFRFTSGSRLIIVLCLLLSLCSLPASGTSHRSLGNSSFVSGHNNIISNFIVICDN